LVRAPVMCLLSGERPKKPMSTATSGNFVPAVGLPPSTMVEEKLESTPIELGLYSLK